MTASGGGGALAATALNGVKIYNLSSGKTLPQWMSQKQKRSLSKDEEYRRRVELVQDFHFPTASHCIKMSRDGNYIVGTGTYKPTLKVFDVRDLSLKFERGLDAEAVNFEILSEDFGKLAFLHNNRTVSFHAPYGIHYTTRIPKFGRDILYDRDNAEIYICGTGPDVFRLNLDEGRFMKSIESSSRFSTNYEDEELSFNVMAKNPCHQLVAAGSDKGVVETWDVRTSFESNNSLASLDNNNAAAITSLAFHSDGLTFATGSSDGKVALYDLRSSKPVLTKVHQYGLPIQNIKFHNYADSVISTDAKVMKIWKRQSGEIFTNVETPAQSAQICVASTSGSASEDSGVILAAGEQSRVMSFYIPELGYAPKWCSFLDSLTEELEEESQATVYDNYQFITREELGKLELSHLVGTSLLKAYMHGYFVDSRLYAKVKSSSSSTEDDYESWRKKQIKEKLAEKQANRITIKKRLPKVNKELASKLLRKNKDTDAFENPLGDDRFKQMFTSTDFEVNEESDTWKLLHPTNPNKYQAAIKDEDSQSDEDDDRFDLESEEEELEGRCSDADSTSSEDEEEDQLPKITTGAARKPQFYSLGAQEKLTDLVGFGKSKDNASRAAAKKLATVPLADRVATEASSGNSSSSSRLVKENNGVVREMTYVPQKKQQRNNAKRSNKRGVEDLKLAKPWDGKRKYGK